MPQEEGREREMVARQRARYDIIDAKKGPVYSGAKKDWKTFEFLMTGFLERYDLVDTILNNDPDKNSEDEHKMREALRRDKIAFGVMTEMIDTRKMEGERFY